MRYYVVAGERSGDLHGGNLVKALHRYDADAVWQGFGGEELEAAGVKLKVHYREMAFMGFVSLLTSLFKIFKFIDICKKDILEFNPDAVILIDYGGFNLKIARFAHSHGYKVFYYIPPKVWAWNQKRAWKLKRFTDRMFVILPFEKDFFKKYDVEVDYVGNPVLDAINAHTKSTDFLTRHKLSSDKMLVALLPGSRKIELKKIVPLMAEVASTNRNIQFVVAAVNNLSQELYEDLKDKPNVKFVEGETYDLLSYANAAIVTSGTATLETALFNVPQMVVYKTSGIEYTIARSVIRVKFISLVNLIAGKEVVKEFIQSAATKNTLHNELKKLLEDASYSSTIKGNYKSLFELLNTGSASENTARLITNYLTKK